MTNLYNSIKSAVKSTGAKVLAGTLVTLMGYGCAGGLNVEEHTSIAGGNGSFSCVFPGGGSALILGDKTFYEDRIVYSDGTKQKRTSISEGDNSSLVIQDFNNNQLVRIYSLFYNQGKCGLISNRYVGKKGHYYYELDFDCDGHPDETGDGNLESPNLLADF